MSSPRTIDQAATADGAGDPTRGSDFAKLSRRIAQAGLLERRPGYYAVRFALVGCLFVGSWTAFFAVGDSWFQILVAVALAVGFAQVALIAHDLAHRQIFRSRRPSEIMGLILGNLGIGMSYGWWMDKHTRHHANPNNEDHDPDVSAKVIVWSTNQASVATGVAKYIGGRQAFLFFPLLTLEGMNLHVASFRALGRRSLRNRPAEAALLVAHVALYLTVVFTTLSPAVALVFIAVHQGVFGVYLGSTFAPNHKGMPMVSAADQLDFFRRQVLTSRNVRGGHAVNIALGGLNYQIEHHLFPSMPSPNLPKAQQIVEAYCEELGVAYHQSGLLSSYGQVLRHLHSAGASLRARAAA